MSHTEDDAVPVLNAVIESGNESIIQSSRLGREVLRELEVLQRNEPVKFVLDNPLLDEEEGGTSHFDLTFEDSDPPNAPRSTQEHEIELMIDELVDRHITELRKDIKHLLMQVIQKP